MEMLLVLLVRKTNLSEISKIAENYIQKMMICLIFTLLINVSLHSFFWVKTVNIKKTLIFYHLLNYAIFYR